MNTWKKWTTTEVKKFINACQRKLSILLFNNRIAGRLPGKRLM
jgi:hypothetical protein